MSIFLVPALALAACNGEGEAPEVEDENLPDAGDEAEDGDVDDGDEESGDGSALQMGTGSTGGTYYALGQEMANVMNEHVDVDDFQVNAVATDASVENIARVSDQDLELGLTVHIPAIDALEGEGDFQGQVMDNFGFMGYVYPETNQIAILADEGIESVEDLEGMRVNIGPPGSASHAASTLILEAHDIGEDDFEAYEEGFGDGASMLQDGNVDATFGLLGLPATNIEELATQQDIDLLGIEDEALEDIEANSEYEHITIESDAYDFLEEDVEGIAAYAVLIGSTEDVDEDLGYEIVAGMYENAEDVSHAQGEHMTMENIMLGSEDLPLHPGAERYFEENDLLDQ
ncbi:TRAP transporter substrate-binding protein [Salicibibacter kimchii]|uniref:TRAP transporter substrate-binding protein n=2 Tax=Salicibibacter kimchii TaxID=2099786 RepID=A0A345C3V9_9BACI|nr:TRAP transporter substrate-binding protein [Salicibibacter kimchii]